MRSRKRNRKFQLLPVDYSTNASENKSTMKLLYFFLAAFLCVNVSLGEGLKCTLKPEDVPKKTFDMVKPCATILEKQIQIEVRAAVTYLAMGAHFARDVINRPGFSKFFFEAANEEREHAIKILEYLLMRGQLTNGVRELLSFPLDPIAQEWKNGYDALNETLKMETEVTRNIRDIIITCEKPHKGDFNDYHVVDYFTAEFLDEQYKSERDIAGKLSTLGKMMATRGELGEYLFDKKLLNNEL